MPHPVPAMNEDLVAAAMMLRERAPQEWEAFVKQVAMHAAALAGDMVRSPAGDLVLNQGKAQQAHSFSSFLRDIRKHFENIQQRRAV